MVHQPKLPYEGREVAFLTQHGKQNLLREMFESNLGCRLLHTDAFDTDKLGTFTLEIPRSGSQLAAARQKSSIGKEITGARTGLASEGSFGPDPHVGLFKWNTEILLWVDDEQGLEVSGIASGPAQNVQSEVRNTEELMRFANEAKFPTHHLIVRPESAKHPQLLKGIQTQEQLLNAFHTAMAQSSNGLVSVENDLRAFANPTRQEIIKNAATDLIQKLKSTCPTCIAPGYWRVKKIPGLLCSFCHHKTLLPVAEIWKCQACDHEDQQDIPTTQFADPSRCVFCNP